jgi:hypothetical protein
MDYGSCRCSPTGKMPRTSQPYKPGDPVYWTVYTYDGLGRTIAVQAADGHSTTTYSYVGNTTLTTDAKENWKANVTDVNGNLTSVIEPDPATLPLRQPAHLTVGLNVAACCGPATPTMS